jgi:hypothetical protein
MEPESSLPFSQYPANAEAYVTFRNKTVSFLRWDICSHSPIPQAVGIPFVGCPRLKYMYSKIEYIFQLFMFQRRNSWRDEN